VRVTSNEHLGQEIPRHLPPLTFMHSCCRCSITREQSDFKISRYSSSQYGRNHPQSRQSTTNLFDNSSSPLCVISTLFSSIPACKTLPEPPPFHNCSYLLSAPGRSKTHYKLDKKPPITRSALEAKVTAYHALPHSQDQHRPHESSRAFARRCQKPARQRRQ
jgi:hypothetical protein